MPRDFPGDWPEAFLARLPDLNVDDLIDELDERGQSLKHNWFRRPALAEWDVGELTLALADLARMAAQVQTLQHKLIAALANKP